jgi:hypothetical protein
MHSSKPTVVFSEMYQCLAKLLFALASLLVLLVLASWPGSAAAETAVYEGVSSCSAKYPGSKTDFGTQKCFTCPDHMPDRTLNAVISAEACVRPATIQWAKARHHGKAKGLFGTDCPDGQFWDPNGRCYSCPAKMDRSLEYGVTSSKACYKRQTAAYTAAAIHGTAGCPEGTFQNGLTKKCFSCPAGTYRNANIANDLTKINACTRCGSEGDSPCPLTTARKSCDPGLAEDFLKGKCVASEEELMRRDAMARIERMGADVLLEMSQTVLGLSNDRDFVSALGSQDGSDPSAVNRKTDAAKNPCFSDSNQTWTLGLVADAKALIGAGLETGVAVDVSVPGRTGSQRPAFAYGGAEWTLQLGGGGSAGVNYGCWRAGNNALKGDYHGIQFDLIGMGMSGAAIATKSFAVLDSFPGGFAIGFYYDPHGGSFDPARDYLGFTLTPVFGKDIDLTGIAYVRGSTGQVTGSFPPPLSIFGDEVFRSFYTFKSDSERLNEFIMGGPNLARVRSYSNGTPGPFHTYERDFFAGTQNVFVAQGGKATYTIQDNGELTWRANNGSGKVIYLKPVSEP